MRRGKKVETIPREGATEQELARMMVGREVLLRVDKPPAHPGEPVLTVEHLSVFDDRGLPAVRDVSFQVRAGEIVGVAGVDGNGQSELIDGITGLRKIADGRVVLGDEDITTESVSERLDDGLGHIPEDRQRRGLVLEFTLAENVSLHDFDKPPVARFGWLSPRRMIQRARDLLSRYDVRGGGPQTRAAALSGGNQQKVVLAREVERDPRLLVAAQPTRGLDVGAIEFVHRRLVEERDEGRAILLISFELEEILSLSDRILVIFEGRIVGEYPPTVSAEELGIAMIGATRTAA
jgi:simple sugar transport system ATP-binding protein